jgi:branched-chain amino acid transport system ATP-binding protein
MPDGLTAEGVDVRFGGIVALSGVSLTLARQEILGLIGPNGAGKTTLINVMSGFQRPTSGSVRIDGAAAGRLRPQGFALAGVVRTFQAVRPFPRLTVAENIEVAAVSRGLSRTAARQEARRILAALHLDTRADLPAQVLSFGEEHRLGLGRALALAPRYLLLDEPAAGLNAAEVADLARLIVDVRDRLGCGVLVIDHNMAFIMGLCQRLHVLASGRTLLVGPAEAVRADAGVRRAYLGADAA